MAPAGVGTWALPSQASVPARPGCRCRPAVVLAGRARRCLRCAQADPLADRAGRRL